MDTGVGLPVIGFLEEDRGPDSRFFEADIVLFTGSRDINIDTADIPFITLYGVNCTYCLKDVLDRTLQRMFSRFQSKPFVAEVFKYFDFFSQFFG